MNAEVRRNASQEAPATRAAIMAMSRSLIASRREAPLRRHLLKDFAADDHLPLLRPREV